MSDKFPLVLNSGSIEELQSGDTIDLDSLDLSGYVPTITSDTTYYIDTGGSDVTGNGSSGSPWATIGHAIEYLMDYYIASGVYVTIQFNDGHYTLTSLITNAHNQGGQIKVTGETTYSKSLTSVQSSSGASGGWTYIINLADVTNIEVGDAVLIPSSVSGGTYPTFITGCHIITNVDAVNNRITFITNHVHASAASGAVSGTVTILKTVLYNSTSGILYLNDRQNFYSMEKICFYSDGTQYGFFLDGYSKINDLKNTVGICNCTFGIIIRYGSLVKNCPYISSCTYGIHMDAPSTYRDGANTTVISGCTYGLNIIYLSAAVAVSQFITGCTVGINCSTNSFVSILSGTIDGCGTGIYAAHSGFVNWISATMQNNTTDYDPVANTRGNNEGYILVA